MIADFFNGKKNYVFAFALIGIGLVEWAFPVMQVRILTMSTPQDFITAGIAWGLGRNAISKAGIKWNQPGDGNG